MIVARITIYIHKAMTVYVITYDTVMAFSMDGIMLCVRCIRFSWRKRDAQHECI